METMENELQDMVAEELLASLVPELEAAWKNLWHNASVDLPDIEDDEEWERFWDWLGDYTRMEIEFIQEQVYEEFGETVTLYQYGRGGATIAPDELRVSYSGIGGLGSYHDGRWCDDDGLDALPVAQQDLAIIQFIDDALQAAAAYVPEGWAEEKRQLAA